MKTGRPDRRLEVALKRRSAFTIGLLALTGCTTGPRASMFAPVGRSPVELMSPEADPFLETPSIPVSPRSQESLPLPKLGPISSAARQHMWRAANTLTGPAPKSLPSSIPLADRKTPATEAIGQSQIGQSQNGKHVEARPTSKLTGDGQRGFVQLLPPPPDDTQGIAPRDSRFFELPPPPEN
jgi:hypothetical protein